MQIQLTAVFREAPQGYIGFVKELPGANTQGATLEEARGNLQEAVTLVLEANRAVSEEEGTPSCPGFLTLRLRRAPGAPEPESLGTEPS